MKCFNIDLSKLLWVTLLDKQVFLPPHRHVTRCTAEYVLYVVESGRLLISSGGERFELVAGDVVLFDKGEEQFPIEATECSFSYLHFDTHAVTACEMSEDEYCETIRQRKMSFIRSNVYGSSSYSSIGALIARRMHVADREGLDLLLGILKNNAISYGSNTPEWRLSVSHAAARFLMILENLSYEALCGGYSGKVGRVHSTVERIVGYVTEHFRESFSGADLERELFINFDYANRIFKKNTGYSIMKYRNRLRINTAKALVVDKTLSEVASEVGFSSIYYFSRCFKSLEGISPDEYRASLRLGEGKNE
jgi:AraC-like DNA-binding protein